VPLTDDEVTELAQKLFDARAGAAWTQGVPRLSGLAELDGYRVQAALLDLHLDAGDSLAGYKIGLTSPAAQTSYGASAPAWGFLLQSSVLDTTRNPRLPHVQARKIEAELAFVFGEDLPEGEVSSDDVVEATSTLRLAAEIVDTRWLGGAADLGSLVADDVSNAAVALGPQVAAAYAGSADIRAVVRAAGREEAGSSAAVLGRPANAVAWLASALAQHGLRLAAGQLVMSGSFGTPLAVDPEDDVLLDFGELGCLELSGAPVVE